MTRYGLVCLLFGTLAWGQAASPAAPPSAEKPAAPTAAQPGAPNQDANAQPDLSKIAPEQPVITIAGLCDNPPADKTAASDCKTVITRQDFEKMINAVQPTMPQRARRQFAGRYADALVRAQKAHEMGLDQGPEFEEHLKIARLSIMSQELGQAMQKKAAEVTPKDIEDYYQAHVAEFEEADVRRIYIPRAQQPSAAKPKSAPGAKGAAAADKDDDKDQDKDDNDKAEKKDAGEKTMKAEADKLLVRAKAGEDFDKLQAEAFVVAGIKMKSPTTKLGDVRRSSLNPSQASCMDLKIGAVSSLLSDQSGYYICKVAKRDTPTLEKASEEIRGTLTSERMQAAMEAVEHSATTTFEDGYFGPAPPIVPRGGMPRPMAPSQPPPSGPK